MSTSEEILRALQQVGVGIGQAVAAVGTAKGKAEQAIAQSAALGARDKIAEFTALKSAIEELTATLTGSREKTTQVVTQARAAAG